MVPRALGGARYREFAIRMKTISRPPVGHVKMGLLYIVPNKSVRISTLVASRSRRGRNWTCLNPSRVGAESGVVVHAARHVGPVDR